MARIYDNIEVKFTEGLQGIISSLGVKRVDFCVGYFNLRGWNLVVDQIDKLPGDNVYENDKKVKRTCRLLIGMHRPPEELLRRLYGGEEYIPDSEDVLDAKRRIAEDFRNQLLIGLPTNADQNTLRHLTRQLKEGKVCVKLYLREPLHAKLYLAYRPDDHYNPIPAILGSSNLTYSGLTGNGELNAEFADSDSAKKLSDWFEDRWNDRFCVDITEELIKALEESWASEEGIPPYYIYLKTAYHLSEEARMGVKEFSLPPEFRKDLFDFQQTAVKIAARHLHNEKRGGAMIGDVVGLGKTITACAIAKLYENTYGSNTLIICPANLQEMWKKYRKKYDLKADVISMAAPLDPDKARYYKLIIVDESHNLRNSNGSRYQKIQALIQKQNSSVLLLTATPYNMDFRDLSNQLKLFIEEDQDLGIRPEIYIKYLGGEREFLMKHNEVFIRSIKAFEQSPFVEDWNELMKLFLVRRTRTFIKDNYAKEDPENKRRFLEFPDGTKSYFPDRIPRSIKFPTDPKDQYSRLYSDEMISLMESLKLPRYGLIHYISEDRTVDIPKSDQLVIDNLSRAGERMMGFCKSTFFKRMDSCGYSFLLTLYHHLLRNAVFMYALDNGLNLPIGDENALPDDFIDDEDTNVSIFGDKTAQIPTSGTILAAKPIPTDFAAYEAVAKDHYETIKMKNNVSWLRPTYFKRTLKQQLRKDSETIIKMIELCGVWNPDEDKKVKSLYDLLNKKHGKDKVIVFTQYSDTAMYLYAQLKQMGMKQIYYVTGDSKDPTKSVDRFSPKSNGQDIDANEQYRVLIATDVLSEGQNLQDSHVIVNYDMPWAIIRLIQRAGRVDRIGQESKEIFCYSFFPADGIETIIRLRSRLNKRINENANVVGSDEVFFEGNEKNLMNLYNEQSGILDQEEGDSDVDLSSQAYQIWQKAIKSNPKLKEIIPALSDMIYATKATAPDRPDGVITFCRTYNDFDILSWYDRAGNLVSQSQKKILTAMECTAKEPALPQMPDHFDLVKKSVEDIGDDIPSAMGVLGNRFSTRYRIVQLLENFYSQQTNLFYDEDYKQQVKLAVDDIYNYQLIETTKTVLGRMLNKGDDQEEIVEAVLDFRKKGVLCRKQDSSIKNKEPKILCSMGLTKM
jgi:superfamily II DNA or RNA helicase